MLHKAESGRWLLLTTKGFEVYIREGSATVECRKGSTLELKIIHCSLLWSIYEAIQSQMFKGKLPWKDRLQLRSRAVPSGESNWTWWRNAQGIEIPPSLTIWARCKCGYQGFIQDFFAGGGGGGGYVHAKFFLATPTFAETTPTFTML